MRFVVLILMLALLPLRLWAAQDMAVRMAHAEAVGTSDAAAPDHALGQPMPDDCPMAAGGNGTGSPEEAPASGSMHCLSCHLCAAAALHTTLTADPRAAPMSPGAQPGARFASAELRLEHKPPIS